MKLMVDMNLSPRWVSFLTAAQFEAVHWSNIGPVNATDSSIMTYARENGYVVLTQDLDFSAILAATKGTKPSVVQIRSDELSPNAIGTQLINALRQLEVQLQTGALVSVEPRRTKVRASAVISRPSTNQAYDHIGPQSVSAVVVVTSVRRTVFCEPRPTIKPSSEKSMASCSCFPSRSRRNKTATRRYPRIPLQFRISSSWLFLTAHTYQRSIFNLVTLKFILRISLTA